VRSAGGAGRGVVGAVRGGRRVVDGVVRRLRRSGGDSVVVGVHGGGVGSGPDVHRLTVLQFDLIHPGRNGFRIGIAEGRLERAHGVVQRTALDVHHGTGLDQDLLGDLGDHLAHLLGELVVEQVGEGRHVVRQIADQEGLLSIDAIASDVEAHTLVLRRNTKGFCAGHVHQSIDKITNPSREREPATAIGDTTNHKGPRICHLDGLQHGSSERTLDHLGDDLTSNELDHLATREGAQGGGVALEVGQEVDEVREPHHERSALMGGGTFGDVGQDQTFLVVDLELVLAQSRGEAGAPEVVLGGLLEANVSDAGIAHVLDRIALTLAHHDSEEDCSVAPALGMT